ncbi:MAG: hemerythrin domain-containing protein [Candidatus Omnitrophica bacterium]|nr:hemerythrin domain-containing protein [Candidatus Omnitrophota bacterium]MDD5488790.1 hemerythrin domain-containing protein [Candidatus Omnitrophota bacterium]
MMPVGPLMIEHRIIERMIKIMRAKLENISKEGKVDPVFIDTAVDFIRTYADRCHHGKEEDILFRDLAKKKISDEHKRIMNELIEEHKMGRNNVKNLIEAKEKYVRGDNGALTEIVSNIETLVNFYPKHIEKEDKHFFLPCMDYFTDVEKDAMLNEMWEFDRKMIHEKYTKVVECYEKRDQIKAYRNDSYAV